MEDKEYKNIGLEYINEKAFLEVMPIAEFMGWTLEYIGYYGGSDESEFQVKNEAWLGSKDIEAIGYYLINKGTDQIIEIRWVEKFYHNSWDWLCEVCRKTYEIGNKFPFSERDATCRAIEQAAGQFDIKMTIHWLLYFIKIKE